MFMPVMTFYRVEGLPILNQIMDQFWAVRAARLSNCCTPLPRLGGVSMGYVERVSAG